MLHTRNCHLSTILLLLLQVLLPCHEFLWEYVKVPRQFVEYLIEKKSHVSHNETKDKNQLCGPATHHTDTCRDVHVQTFRKNAQNSLSRLRRNNIATQPKQRVCDSVNTLRKNTNYFGVKKSFSEFRLSAAPRERKNAAHSGQKVHCLDE